MILPGRRLDPRLFLRIHRSAIVNIEAIAELRSLFHGDYDVLLRDGTALPVGRTYRDRLLGGWGIRGGRLRAQSGKKQVLSVSLSG